MIRYKSLIVSILFVMVCFCSCKEEIPSIEGVKYSVEEKALYIDIVLKNNSDYMLLFPFAVGNCIQTIEKHGKTVIMQECNIDFKNFDQMVEIIKKEDEMWRSGKKELTFETHNCICTDVIRYKVSEEVPSNIIINFTYGKVFEWKMNGENCRVQKGKLIRQSISIPITFKSYNSILYERIPFAMAQPVWDFEEYPSPFDNGEINGDNFEKIGDNCFKFEDDDN